MPQVFLYINLHIFKEIMNKILITGITGTIAKHLIAPLINMGASVTAVSRSPVSVAYGVNVIYGDLTDETFLLGALKGIDVVIHAAALTRSADCELLSRSNESITSALVNAAISNNVKRFIFFSSDLANHTVGPYGASKRFCEHIISSSSLIDWAILRLGPFLSFKASDKNSTIFRLLQNARKGKRLWLPMGGNFSVGPVTVEDLSAIVISAILYKSVIKKIYNVASFRITLRGLISLAAPSAKITPVPMWLIFRGLCLFNFLNFRHPYIETLTSLKIGAPPIDKNLELDFNFKPKPVNMILSMGLD